MILLSFARVRLPAIAERVGMAALMALVAAGCRAATGPDTASTFQLTTDRTAYAPGDTATVVLHLVGGDDNVTYSHCPAYLDQSTAAGSWTSVVGPGPNPVCTLELPVARPGTTVPILKMRIPTGTAAGTYRVRIEGAFGPVAAPGPTRTYSTPAFTVGTSS